MPVNRRAMSETALTEFTPLMSFAGGLLIGLSALLLMLTWGRIAGMTAIIGGILPPLGADWSWKTAFLAGAILAPFALSISGYQVEYSVPVSTGALIVGGLVTLFIGAELLVRGATNLARDFGVSEAVIGLTVVAVGTSLPELATGIMSALRKHSDIMIGNIVGSNIFNILFILGVTSVIQPIAVAPRFGGFDVPIMLGITLGFSILLLAHLGVRRLTAGAMLVAYVGYTVALVQV